MPKTLIILSFLLASLALSPQALARDHARGVWYSMPAGIEGDPIPVQGGTLSLNNKSNQLLEVYYSLPGGFTHFSVYIDAKKMVGTNHVYTNSNDITLLSAAEARNRFPEQTQGILDGDLAVFERNNAGRSTLALVRLGSGEHNYVVMSLWEKRPPEGAPVNFPVTFEWFRLNFLAE